MNASFPAALALVLKSEGGFTDNPADPGGATDDGITQATYDAYRTVQGLPLQSVRLITLDEAGAIYRHEFWDVLKDDALPAGVDYAMFDFAVNSGPPRAAKFLQHVLFLQTDGAVGPKTVDTASRADPELLCFALCLSRLRFMQSLSTWADFGKGWSARVFGVFHQSIRLCSSR